VSAPRWARRLLARLAPEGRGEEVVGDLEEAHRRRVEQRGRPLAYLLTTLETLDMAFALLRDRGSGGSVSWLDFKLGLRMLVRYPGLTALGGLAIAFAIFVGAGTFEFLTQVAHPSLPFEDGERMVGIQVWNAAENDGHARVAFEYGVWSEELETIEEMGAFHSVVRNLIVGEGATHLVEGAVMDAAGFRITGVEPLLGRALVEDDERPGAPPVVVLGHGLWERVFDRDPEVVGRVVRIGTERATVVGVMPEGFTFPVVHELWLPLRLDPGALRPGEGPTLAIFGRLAPGASLDDARVEVERIGERLAAAHPDPWEHLRPQVKPYARAMLGLPGSLSDMVVSAVVMAWNLPLVLFLLLVCGNVALLMFARTAARESELTVRSALGAGRRRIVGQLFAEALVLAGVGAVVGLAFAEYGLRWGYFIVETEQLDGPLPFWFQPELSARTVIYALVLTVLGAVIAGVVPALKATRGLGARLRHASAGGGGFRFGGWWTAVIVSQIAITAAFPAVTLAVALEGREIATYDLGIPTDRYLTAQLSLQPAATEPPGSPGGPGGPGGPGAPGSPGNPSAERLAATVRATFADLEQRLLADPRVGGVTFAERAPRMYTGWHQIEVDGATAPPQDERGHRMGSVDVEVDFFRTLGIDPLAGRDFTAADAGEGARVAIVNEAFLDYVLGGRSALGVRFRYLASESNRDQEEPGPWHEIVGVVQDLGPMSGYSHAVIYHPVPPGSLHPVYALLYVRGTPATEFGARLRAIAFDVDPTLRIDNVQTLAQVDESTVEFYRFWVFALMLGSAVGLVLSLGGIYAVTSFSVARRTREIGVRVALGASDVRVVSAVLRRPLRQLALGILMGSVLLVVLFNQLAVPSLRDVAIFVGYIAVVTVVCLLACIVPTRRALSVQPSEALRAEQ